VILRPAGIAAALFLLAVSGAGRAETFIAQVIAVLDGDTVMVLHASRKSTLRLAGIDAPEKQQAFGRESRDALAALVLRKEVHVTTRTVDEYGRVVAVLQAGNINVNEEQLRRGMAWEYSRYHSDKTLIALQADAQRARRGLWVQASPAPPWEFRKAHAPARESNTIAGACGSKRYCAQMVSCEEARYYLTQCRVKTLDRNGDGMPCETLCNPKPH
jgi:micrococcal nuclease